MQPEPKRNDAQRPASRWRVQAHVGRMGMGNARSTVRWEHSQVMWAATREEALERQKSFIDDYLHAEVRSAPSKRARATEAEEPFKGYRRRGSLSAREIQGFWEDLFAT